MRVAIMAVGSRGDVQPMLALAHGLQAAGHTAVLATHAAFAPLAGEHGLTVSVELENPFTGMNSGVGGTATAEERKAEAARPFEERAERAMVQWMRGGLAAGSGADAIVFMPLSFVGAYVGEKLGILAVKANYSPGTPTRAFPSIYAPPAFPRFVPQLNWLSHWVEARSFWVQMRAMVNRARGAALSLPPLRGSAVNSPELPVLYEYSPALLPAPPDWPANHRVTGFWTLPEPRDMSPNPELLAFLAAGPPPVYLGLGSIGNSGPVEVTRTLLRALAQIGARTIVSPGQVSLEGMELPAETYVAGDTPHSWLLPRCAALICHGGIGTVGAGLRAGIPALVIPFFGDQHYWGRRVHEVGAGPASLANNRVTPERALRACRDLVENPSYRRRAAELGAAIRAEDGVARAVATLEGWVAARAAARATPLVAAD